MSLTYDDALRQRLQHNLDRHQRTSTPLDGRRHAGVAIVVVDSESGSDHIEPAEHGVEVSADDRRMLDSERMDGVSGGAAFLLIRRTAGRSHARQWALPGGKVDEGETVVEAAMREVHEEVGVRFSEAAVLGLLDDYPTRSGFVMTPVVIWGGGRLELDPEPGEVYATYRVGLSELKRDDSPRFIEIPESDRPVVQMPLGGALVHAPTGAVLLQFAEVCLDGQLNKRVDHLEQPVFAWK